MPHRRVTIGDVAKAAGVSVATVSKVINDRYGVSAATASRVKAVVSELGYESSLIARSLRSHRTNVLGVLVADIEPFSAELLKGVARAIKSSGYELIVYSGGGHGVEHAGWERRSVSRLSGTLADGIIIVTPTVDDVGEAGPIVAVDPHRGDSTMPNVHSDNLAGAITAMEYLSASAIDASASSPAALTSSRLSGVSRATTRLSAQQGSTSIPNSSGSAGTSSRRPASRPANCSSSPTPRRRSSAPTTSRRSRR